MVRPSTSLRSAQDEEALRNLFILSEAPKARSRRALLLSLLVLPLAACGKKGAL